MKRGPLVLLALVLFVGLAFVWSALGDGPRASGEGARASSADASADRGAPAAPSRSAELDRPAAPPDRPAERATPVAPRAIASAGGKLELLVLARETGAPVAGAEIVAVSEAVVAAARPRDGTEAVDLAALAGASGVRATSGADGRATLEVPSRHVEVEARAGELYGALSASHVGRRVERLVLERDLSLDVRVVDASRAPAPGVRVLFGRVLGGRPTSSASAITSAPDGVARFAHLQRFLAGGGEPCVRVARLARTSHHEPVVLDAPRATPIELVVEPGGTLEVDVRDAAGQPVEGAFLQADWDGRATADALVAGLQPDAWSRNVATWRNVQPELAYVVKGFADAYRPATLRVQGPSATGDVVRATLVFAEGIPMLAGRLVDADGEPLRETGVAASFTISAPSSSASAQAELRTDAEGRFTTPFTATAPASAELPRASAWFGVRDAGPRVGHGVRVDLTGKLAPGVVDLGDLRVEEAPVVVAGVVVDPDGAPVEGATIVCRAEGAPGSAGTRPVSLAARTDEAGAFLVVGPLATERVRVLVQRAGFAKPDDLVLATGTRDARIVLALHAAVEGSYRFDRRVPKKELLVHVRPRGGGVGTSEGTATLAEDGSWHVDGRAPGLYDVVLTLRLDPTPIHLVEGVRLETGEVARDPRSQAVDLSGVLGACELRVSDATGGAAKPLAGIASVYEADGRRQASYVIEEGRAELLLVRPPLLVDVSVPGYRPDVLERVDGDRSVQLARGLPVRLALDSAVTPPMKPFELQYELDLVEMEVGELSPAAVAIVKRGISAIDALSGSFDATNARGVAQTLPVPGLYRVVFHVLDVDTGLVEPLPGSAIHEIVARDGDRADFVLAPDPAAIEAAVEALRARPR